MFALLGLPAALAILLVLSAILGEVGDRIPIWNEYIGGIIMASIFGVVIGLVFGKSPVEILTLYMLPIMGGGTGAGAIPMSEIYASATGETAEKFLSFALPILTIANILCIFTASVLNKIENVKPEWTGNGELLKGNAELDVDRQEQKVELKLSDVGAGLALACTFYMLGTLFSKFLLPSVLGVKIHTYAYMIVFVALSNVFNVIPSNMKQGAKRLQSFFGSNLLWLQIGGAIILLLASIMFGIFLG